LFENRVLRKIVRPKTREVTGEWRELHNEELNDLYFSQNVIHYQRRMRWAEEGSRVREISDVYRVLGET
jgi:hypothetical protein